MIGSMRNSHEVVEDLLALTSELWETLEREGISLKGRVLGIQATDQFMVSVFHTAVDDKHMLLRKRTKSG